MSVVSELRDYLIGVGLTAAGKIKASSMPADGSVNLAEGQWGIYQLPGSISGGNLVQWKRTHNIAIVHRNKDGDALYQQDDRLLEALSACVTLPSYRILRLVANPGGELPRQENNVHVMQWAVVIDLVLKSNNSEES